MSMFLAWAFRGALGRTERSNGFNSPPPPPPCHTVEISVSQGQSEQQVQLIRTGIIHKHTNTVQCTVCTYACMINSMTAGVNLHHHNICTKIFKTVNSSIHLQSQDLESLPHVHVYMCFHKEERTITYTYYISLLSHYMYMYFHKEKTTIKCIYIQVLIPPESISSVASAQLSVRFGGSLM